MTNQFPFILALPAILLFCGIAGAQDRQSYTFTNASITHFAFISDPNGIIGECPGPPPDVGLCLNIARSGGRQPATFNMTAPASVVGTKTSPNSNIQLGSATFNVVTSGFGGLTVQISNGDRNGKPDAGVTTCSGGGDGFSCVTNGLTTVGTTIELNMRFQVTSTAFGGSTASFGVFVRFGLLPDLTPCSDVTFDHIEVVQTIQYVDNSVTLSGGKPTLVAGKPTVARVFVKLADPPAQPVYGITAVLRGFVNGRELASSPMALNTNLTVQNAMPRNDATKSLNFNLPADWIAEGQLTLQADITAPPLPCAARTDPLKFSGNTSVQFQTFRRAGRTSLTIAWIPYRYQQGGTLISCPGNSPTCPDESLIPTYDYVLKKLYPLAPDSVSLLRLDVPQPVAVDVIRDDQGMVDFLETLKKFYLASEARFYDVLLAVLPSLPKTFGISESIPGRVALIAQMNVGSSLPLEDGYHETRWNGDNIAHEIGHLMGRPHTNNKVCTPAGTGSGDLAPPLWTVLFGGVPTDWPYDTADVQEVGFDIDTKKATPATYGDLMSHCRQLIDPATGSGITRWISPFTYNKLISVGLEPGGALPTAVRPSERTVTRDASPTITQIIVSGWAKSDGSAGGLDPAYQVASADVPPASQDKGSHCIHFSGSPGALGDFCFTLPFANPDTGAPLDRQRFALKIAIPDGTTRMSLVTNGNELAALSANAQPPNLTITSPAPGDQWTGGPRTIVWSGSDPAGGSVVYSVLYSSDGGQSWLPLALDMTDSQFTFDPSQIKGGDNVFFRVMASSGLSTASVDVGPVSVRQTPAIAASTGKLNFTIRAVGDSPIQTFVLSNSGSGPLTVSSFQIDNPVFRVLTPSAPLRIPASGSAVLMVQWVSNAAGPVAGNLVVASDDPANSKITIALAGIGPAGGGSIQLSASSLDFGSVTVGTSQSKTLTIRNSGNAGLNVTGLTAAAPFAVVSPAAPFSVAAGASSTVIVRFAPANSGPQSGSLTIASDDPDRPSLAVNLTGTGVAAPPPSMLSVSPSSLDYGNVNGGELKELGFTFKNNGSNAVTIASVTSSNVHFYRRLPEGAPPYGLPPGISIFISFYFAPELPGPQTGMITITFSDASIPPVRVPVSGTGVGSWFSPDHIDFGTVKANQTKDGYIVLKGNLSKVVTVTVSGSNPAFTLPFGTSYTFFSGQNVLVRFAPKATGPQSGTITITANDPTLGTFTVPVTGTGN